MFGGSASTDTMPPTVNGCPADIQAKCELGTSGAIVTWVEPTATDESQMTHTRSHEPSTEFPVGSTTVAYIFTDTASNTATCTFSVTVETGLSLYHKLNISSFILVSNNKQYMTCHTQSQNVQL